MSHSMIKLPPELDTRYNIILMVDTFCDQNILLHKHSENYQIQIFVIIKLVGYGKLNIGGSF